MSSIDTMASILEAKTPAALIERLDQAVRGIGLEQFMLGIQITDSNGQPEHHVLSTYKPVWQQRYAEAGYVVDDPTVAHCQSSLAPLLWSDKVFGATPALREESASHGITHGLSLAHHEARGLKSMLSLARDKAIDGIEMQQMVSSAKVLASCAHFAFTGFVHANEKAKYKPLAKREREVLQYSSIGKTTSEIAEILCISEPTVYFHINSAMRKLDVSNRVQAIAVALRLGIVN